MKISVNIPSYKRPNAVKTLAYLPFARVWVAPQEFDEYKRNYPQADIIPCKDGVQGFGVPKVRNYILEQEFAKGADVVVIVDDDLDYIARFEKEEGTNYGYKNVKVETDEFLVFIEKYSTLAKDLGACFWGVNCNPDAQSYRHMCPFSTISYIGGPFQVFLKGNECIYDENIPLKEDYDMTIQQLNKHRVVFRANMYHYFCKQSENIGGCAQIRNREKEKRDNEALLKKWGGRIVHFDSSNKGHTTKDKKEDYNPIIKVPIKGV